MANASMLALFTKRVVSMYVGGAVPCASVEPYRV
jgi:hypothetical protein